MNPVSTQIDLVLVLSILYGLVILGVVIVIMTALLRVQVGHSSSLREVFRQSRFLELTTVLVIIVSGTYLAISGKLTEGIVSLLSGIAGYVLGGLAPLRQPQQEAGAAAMQP